MERLEENKNKIEGLLDWISNIGNENKNNQDQNDHISKENGNLPEETSAKGLIDEHDDANGNAVQTPENDLGGKKERQSDSGLDLDDQYGKIKVLLVFHKKVQLFHFCMAFTELYLFKSHNALSYLIQTSKNGSEKL